MKEQGFVEIQKWRYKENKTKVCERKKELHKEE